MKDKVVKICEENLTEKYGALQGATSAADLLNLGPTFGPHRRRIIDNLTLRKGVVSNT